MNKEQVLEYSNRYKKVQKRFAFIVTIVLFLISAGALAGGICLVLAQINSFTKILGIILVAVGIFGLFMTYKFIRFTWNNLKYMDNRDAAEKYCQIHNIK